MKFIRLLIKGIDRLNDGIGKMVSCLVIIMMFSVVYEVVMRYFFKSPTVWSGEVNQYLLCAYTALAGGYALLHGAHVAVDVLYERFSPKKRLLIDIFTAFFAFWFMYLLLRTSGEIAWEAWVESELSENLLFEVPLFPIKVTIPIGAALFLLQLAAKLVRDIEKLVAIYKPDANVSPERGM